MTITTKTQLNDEYLNIAMKLNDIQSNLDEEAMECEAQLLDLIDFLHYLISTNNDNDLEDIVDLEPI